VRIVGAAAIVRRLRLRNDACVTASVYSRAVLKAAELVGGRAQLARVLQVPAGELDKWIGDQAKPPREIFLRIVDIILDETTASGSDDTGEPTPGRDASGASRHHAD